MGRLGVCRPVGVGGVGREGAKAGRRKESGGRKVGGWEQFFVR